MKGLIIGIDPDVDKSGVAVYKKSSKDLQLFALPFFKLLDFLNDHKDDIREVVVEASWKIKKANFHENQRGVGVASQIGARTGANHEVGRKIVEMCAYLGVSCLEKLPLRKCWKGPDGKISHEEFQKLTGYSRRTNQEQRDAALLVWGY
ncbi:hypothetical protein [Sphingobacterium sp. LRF_L2]|uniref:hypothetical protein n=1 Tax=Sphingobacterium sp. LRF_L2 TaxID=3369421 RepID=UPI003F62E248